MLTLLMLGRRGGGVFDKMLAVLTLGGGGVGKLGTRA